MGKGKFWIDHRFTRQVGVDTWAQHVHVYQVREKGLQLKTGRTFKPCNLQFWKNLLINSTTDDMNSDAPLEKQETVHNVKILDDIAYRVDMFFMHF
jgi:hypothetical protein